MLPVRFSLQVSIVSVSELLASLPSWLVLPAESEKDLEATETRPSAVLSAVGVKVAVKTVLETAFQLESDPPVTKTSDSTRSVDASERVKVSVAVSPAPRDLMSALMTMVGGAVSL